MPSPFRYTQKTEVKIGFWLQQIAPLHFIYFVSHESIILSTCGSNSIAKFFLVSLKTEGSKSENG